MTTLTVTAQGETTIPEELLRHLGVHPGDRIHLELLPNGRAELRAEQPGIDIRDWPKLLEGKGNGRRLTIDAINEAIAEAGAAAGEGRD